VGRRRGRLDTAYGRFWRRFPVPDGVDALPGETWPKDAHRWVTVEEGPEGVERRTFARSSTCSTPLDENPGRAGWS